MQCFWGEKRRCYASEIECDDDPTKNPGGPYDQDMGFPSPTDRLRANRRSVEIKTSGVDQVTVKAGDNLGAIARGLLKENYAPDFPVIYKADEKRIPCDYEKKLRDADVILVGQIVRVETEEGRSVLAVYPNESMVPPSDPRAPSVSPPPPTETPPKPDSPKAKPKDPIGAPPSVPDHPDMKESQMVVSPESRRTDSIFDELGRKKNPDGSINAAHASTDPITWQVTKEYMDTDLGIKIIRDLEEKAGMQEAIKARVFEYALDRMEEVGIETGSPTSDYIIYATFKHNESLNEILQKLAPSKKLNRVLRNSLETAIANGNAHPHFSHTQDFHKDIILARRSDTKRREMELQNSEETLFTKETHVNVPLTASYYWRAHDLAKGTSSPMPYPNQWIDKNGKVPAEVKSKINTILQPADGYNKSQIQLKDSDYQQLAGYMMSHLIAEEKNQEGLFKFEDGKYDQNIIDQTYTAISDMISNASLDEPGNVVALGILALAGFKIFTSNSNWANAAKFGAVALAARHVYMEHTGEDPLEQLGLFTRESAYAGTKFQGELDYFDDLHEAKLLGTVSDLEKRALGATGIRSRIMGEMNDVPMKRLNQWYAKYTPIFNAKGSLTGTDFIKDMPELKGIIKSKDDYEIAQIGLGLLSLFYKRVSYRQLQVSGAEGVPTPDDGMRSVREYMEEHSKLYKKTEDTITFGEVITFYQDSETLLEGTNRSRTIPGSAMAVAGDLAGKAMDYGKDAARKAGDVYKKIEEDWGPATAQFIKTKVGDGWVFAKDQYDSVKKDIITWYGNNKITLSKIGETVKATVVAPFQFTWWVVVEGVEKIPPVLAALENDVFNQLKPMIDGFLEDDPTLVMPIFTAPSNETQRKNDAIAFLASQKADIKNIYGIIDDPSYEKLIELMTLDANETKVFQAVEQMRPPGAPTPAWGNITKNEMRKVVIAGGLLAQIAHLGRARGLWNDVSTSVAGTLDKIIPFADPLQPFVKNNLLLTPGQFNPPQQMFIAVDVIRQAQQEASTTNAQVPIWTESFIRDISRGAAEAKQSQYTPMGITLDIGDMLDDIFAKAKSGTTTPIDFTKKYNDVVNDIEAHIDTLAEKSIETVLLDYQRKIADLHTKIVTLRGLMQGIYNKPSRGGTVTALDKTASVGYLAAGKLHLSEAEIIAQKVETIRTNLPTPPVSGTLVFNAILAINTAKAEIEKELQGPTNRNSLTNLHAHILTL